MGDRLFEIAWISLWLKTWIGFSEVQTIFKGDGL